MTSRKNMQQLLTNSEIQLLMGLMMIGPLLASTPGPNLKGTIFYLLPLNDVMFTEDVLMEVSARSRIECSKKCAETQGCAMCTFHSSPQGPPGHCRLHSQLQTAADGKQSMPGARSMAGRRPCDGGYVQACDRCLKAVKRKVNYTTARQDCTDTHGHLAMAKSSAEFGCLRSFASNNIFWRTWVGADDKDQARVFKWSDGTLLSDKSPLWGTGEPQKCSPGNDCVYIMGDYSGLWDAGCWNTYHYICQKDFK